MYCVCQSECSVCVCVVCVCVCASLFMGPRNELVRMFYVYIKIHYFLEMITDFTLNLLVVLVLFFVILQR